MKRNFYTTLAILTQLTLAISLSSCNTGKVSSETKYVINGDSLLQSSYLNMIDSLGKVNVCYSLIAWDPNPAGISSSRKYYTQIIKSSIQQWLSTLQGHPYWKFQGEIPINMYYIQDAPCPLNNETININIYGDLNAKQFCSRFNQPENECSAFALSQDHVVNIGFWNRGQLQNYIQHPAVILHELGHIFGLADAYQIPGKHDWDNDNQPYSVMRDSNSNYLTNDDKLGIWSTLYFLKTGVRKCDGYTTTEAVMKNNTWNATVCNPIAAPVVIQPPPSYAAYGQITEFSNAAPPSYDSLMQVPNTEKPPSYEETMRSSTPPTYTNSK